MHQASRLLAMLALLALASMVRASPDALALQACLQDQLDTLYPPSTGMRTALEYRTDARHHALANIVLNHAPREGRAHPVALGLVGPAPAALIDALRLTGGSMEEWPEPDIQRNIMQAHYTVVYFSDERPAIDLIHAAAQAGVPLRVEPVGECVTPPPLAPCPRGLAVRSQPTAPIFPRRCVGKAIEGSVLVRHLVSAHGEVGHAMVLLASSSLFERSAVEFVSAMRFEPPPAPCYHDQSVTYELDD